MTVDVTIAFMLAGVAAGVAAGFIAARRKGIEGAFVFDVAALGLVLALIVGRLFFILNPPPSVAEFYPRRFFLTHLFDFQVGAIAIWNGGLGRAGLQVGGFLAALIVLWRNPAFSVEKIESLTWGIVALAAVAPVGAVLAGQPIAIALTVWGLIVGGVALWQRLSPLAVLVALYAGIFAIDFTTPDVWRLFGLSGVQWLALAIIITCAVLLYRRNRPLKSNQANDTVKV